MYAELSFARSSGRARTAPLIFFGVQLCGLHYGIIARVVISGFCFRRRPRCSYSYVTEAGITRAEAHSFVRTNEQWYLHLRLFGASPFCSLTHVETCFNQAFVEVATRIILLTKWARLSVYYIHCFRSIMNKSFSYFICLRFTKLFSILITRQKFFSLIINYLFQLLISLESRKLSIFIKTHRSTTARELWVDFDSDRNENPTWWGKGWTLNVEINGGTPL